jgi:hypothetical protein
MVEDMASLFSSPHALVPASWLPDEDIVMNPFEAETCRENVVLACLMTLRIVSSSFSRPNRAIGKVKPEKLS